LTSSTRPLRASGFGQRASRIPASNLFLQSLNAPLSFYQVT
jgi:hypothetical protein